MAKIKNGILGPLSGRIGPVIGGVWKKIAYIRKVSEKPKKSTRSPGQIATQEKMRFINNFLVPFHAYINVGFKNDAEMQTEISAAFTANYHTTIVGVHPNLSVDYSKFIFSKGILPMVSDMTFELISPTVIALNWTSIESALTNFDDQLMLVVYCPELDKAEGFVGGVKRSAKKCTFELEERFVGKTIEVYASMTSFDRKKIANNLYLGKLN